MTMHPTDAQRLADLAAANPQKALEQLASAVHPTRQLSTQPHPTQGITGGGPLVQQGKTFVTGVRRNGGLPIEPASLEDTVGSSGPLGNGTQRTQRYQPPLVIREHPHKLPLNNAATRPSTRMWFELTNFGTNIYYDEDDSYLADNIYIDDSNLFFDAAGVSAFTLQLGTLNPIGANFDVDAATTANPAEAQLYARAHLINV
jgi:hypothetical protein